MSDHLLYQIALTLVPQVGAMTAKNLVSYCGSAEGVFKASRRELLKIPGIGTVVTDSVLAASTLHIAEREMEFLENNRVNAVFYTDEKYPSRLKQCPDSPVMLFFKGSSVQLLNSERIVAIVGTRQPSDYGKAVCEEMVEALKPYNPLIISGLAYGVDITAHRQSNMLDVPNIGILGHGLGSIYPSQHRSIALKMLENGGLLTEYIHSAKPDREHFPMRNRIIAGMCDALIVIETAASGGSMISAQLASDYGRDLFAIPGRTNDPKSTGCNYLIQNGSARLTLSAADIADTMRWEENGKSAPRQTQLLLDLSTEEAVLLERIKQQPEIAIDQLSVATQMLPGELASTLLGLEFKGAIRTLPGKRYIVLS
ncbi:MAG TPA: DNA-processing protein DprA [Saprospiraceae bacterium]|nr:DNA-processing protein DprA [Saprospiraceae bacterium]